MLSQNQTRTYLNTCDLYIEQVKMPSLGYFYIVWKRGKKSIQSLKYQSDGKTVSVRENLTLNIALTVRNGRTVEKNTMVYILDADGKQIDQMTLSVHRWTAQFSRIEVPLAKGKVIAKVRRKTLMEIQGKIDEDEQCDSESQQIHMNSLMFKSDHLPRNKAYLDTYKDEISKIRKQLEDTLYYNNKLKNDRAVLISKNLELQAQLQLLKKTISEEVVRIQKYFKNKIEAREAIYEEEINELVSSFNMNSQYNIVLIRNLIQQQTQMQEEAILHKSEQDRTMKQMQGYLEKLAQIQKQKNSLRESFTQQQTSLEQMSKNNKNYQEEIQKLKLEKLGFERNIEELQQNLKKSANDQERLLSEMQNKMLENERMSEEIEKLKFQNKELNMESEFNKSQLQFTENAYKQEREAYDKNIQGYEEHIRALEQKIKAMEQQMSESQVFLNQTNNNYLEQLSAYKQKYEELLSEVNRQKQENLTLKKENHSLKQMINELDANLLTSKRQIQGIKEEMRMSQIHEQQKINEMKQSIQVLKEEKQANINEMKKFEIKQQPGQSGQFQNGQEKEVFEEVNFDEDLHILCNNEISKLQKKIAKLEEELIFMNENAIKVQEHQALLERVKQFEQIMGEFESKGQSESPLEDIKSRIPEKSIPHSKSIPQSKSHERQEQISIEEAQQITLQNLKLEADQNQEGNLEEQLAKLKSAVKILEQRCQRLEKQKSQLQKKVQTLTVQLSRRDQNQINDLFAPENMEQVEFCSSEDRENQEIQRQQMEQEDPHFYEGEVKDRNLLIGVANKKVMRSSEHFSTQNKQQKQSENKKIRKSMSMKVSHQHSRSPSRSKIETKQEILQVDESEKPKQKIQGYDQQYSAKKISSHISIKYGDEDQHHDRVVRKLSSRSRSHSSMRSGTTYYKLKKVSHRQKINGLQADVKEYEKKQAEWKQKQIQYFQELQTLKQDLEKANQSIESLKQNLEYAKEKNVEVIKLETRQRLIQTEIDTANKNLEADIPDPQKVIIEKQLEENRKNFENSVREYERVIKQNDLGLKYLREKNDQFQKYSEGVLKVSEERNNEIQKLKELLEQSERNKKNVLQDSKIKVAQVEFQLSTSQNENKRLKTSIEDLEDKVRKNDVMDLYKQAQFQAQSANKKNIELNRSIYQLKLEKDTVEDQIKIFKKKVSDLNRKISQIQDNSERLDKSLEEQKKKGLKYQRQLEDKQDKIQKLREQVKRLNDEIANLKNYQTQYLFEKKKMMDQCANSQHALDRKEYEINSLKKEIEKLKQALAQKEEEKMDRRQVLKKELDKQQQIIGNKDKEIFELQSVVKQLNSRLETVQNESKRNIGEKSNLYSQKLRVYVEQISEIRKVLEQNSIQINSLKEQLRQTIQNLQACLSREQKLEQKNRQQLQNQQTILKAYQELKIENQSLKENLYETQTEMQNFKNSIKFLKLDFEREKKQSQMKSQQLEQLTRTNQSNINLINKYKIKLSDFETNSQINKNMGDKIGEAERNNEGLLKQLREIKYVYEEYRGKFVHSVLDMNNAVKKTENKWKERLEEQLEQLKNNYESIQTVQKKKYQGQIVELLNESARLRGQSQKKSQLISQLQHKVTKLEMVPLKLEQLSNLYKKKQSECNKYRELASSHHDLTDKIARLEDLHSKTYAQNQQLLQQNSSLKSQLKSQISSTNQFHIRIKQKQNEVIQFTRQLSERQMLQNQLKAQIAKLLNSVSTLQSEKEELIKRMDESKSKYAERVSNLEKKFTLMGETVSEREKMLENNFEEDLAAMQKQIEAAYLEIEQKSQTSLMIEQSLRKAESLNNQLRKQIERMREKEETENEYFQMEINKLNMKIADMDKIHKNNTQSLELQLQQMSKQLTNLKIKQSSERYLKMSGAGLEDSRANLFRMQEKLKSRDSKIEQLKENIFVYEQTIAKLKKNLSQIQLQNEDTKKLEKLVIDLKNKNNQLNNEIQLLQNKQKISVNTLKEQLNCLRQDYEKLKLLYEEKYLEKESVEYELNTTKQLYLELQKELDKRKIALRGQTEGQSKFNEAIQEKNQLIGSLESQLNQINQKKTESTNQLNKKNQIISTLQSHIIALEKSEAKLKLTLQTKTSEEGKHYRSQIIRLSEENQSLIVETKRLREQNQRLQNENNEARTQISFNQNSIDSLSLNLDQLGQKCKQFEATTRKYQQANQICYKNFMMSIEEALFRDGINQKLQQKQFELTNMVQEIQELKFLNERKYMDYDQLKRENLELEMQLSDAQFATQQVQELRQICDKLEHEKKQAVFRQQFLLMQIQTVIKSSSGQTRSKMLELLNTNHSYM